MKKFYLLTLTLFLILTLNAQTSYEVEVFNFGFDPSSLTIEPGDTVRWVNVEGNHNVNGTTDTYPDNPESFGNQIAASPWTYEFVFTLEGVYDYRCDLHSSAMQGTVTVEGDVSSTSEPERLSVSVYPSPANQEIRIGGLEDVGVPVRFSVFDITGKQALQTMVHPGDPIDIRRLKKGIYIYNITLPEGEPLAGKLFVD
jgi:plastocyanin